MLFTLKKIISAFLMPVSIGLMLFFIGLIFLYSKNYKRAKIFLSFSFLWIAIIAYAPFSNALIKPLENQYNAYNKVDSSINYVLVLGSGHVTNEKISEISQLSNSALMRISEGIRIYRQLKNAKIIFSGYEGTDITPHAIIAKKVAISLGIPEENILTQENAKDTKEEAQTIKRTLGKEAFILVTSASHMPRSMKIFKSENLNPIAAPTDFLSKKDGEFLSKFSAKEIRKTELAMHEYIGILWHSIIEKIKFYVN